MGEKNPLNESLEQKSKLELLELKKNMIEKRLKNNPSLEKKKKSISKYIGGGVVIITGSTFIAAASGTYVMTELLRLPITIESLLTIYENYKVAYQAVGITALCFNILYAIFEISQFKNYKVERTLQKGELLYLTQKLQEEKAQVAKEQKEETVYSNNQVFGKLCGELMAWRSYLISQNALNKGNEKDWEQYYEEYQQGVARKRTLNE